jgi:hypothetical protein
MKQEILTEEKLLAPAKRRKKRELCQKKVKKGLVSADSSSYFSQLSPEKGLAASEQ